MKELSVGEPTLVGALWRFRVLVFAATLVGLGIGFAYSLTLPAFSATASLVLQSPRGQPVFGSASNESPDRYVGDQITVLKSPELDTAAAQVGATQIPPLGLSADYFGAHTTVSGAPLNGDLVQVTFTAKDGAHALAGINAIQTAYEQVVHNAVQAQLATLLSPIDSALASINKQLSSVAAQLATGPPDRTGLLQEQQSLNTRRDTLAQKRDQVLVDASSGSNGVALSLSPQTATQRSRLTTSLPPLAVGGLVGLIGGVILAYLLAYRRPVFRHRDEPGEVLGAPLIAEVPRLGQSGPLPAAGSSATPSASAFRRAALGLQTRQTPEEGAAAPASKRSLVATARHLVVVSAGRQEGRSTIVANLGIALAGNGLTVLLVDADPGTSGLTRLLRGNLNYVPVRGLPDFAPASMTLEGFTGPHQSGGRLTLLRFDQAPVGTSQAASDAILQKLESAFNVMLIDAPPLTAVGPFWQVVRAAGGALVVVDHGASVESVDEVARLLMGIEMPTRGYIYNHRPRLRRKVTQVPEPTPVVAVDRFGRRPPDTAAKSGGIRRAR